MVKELLTRATDKIYSLPVMVLMPHSRCNCRCVMCDIWKANNEKKEITTETLALHLQSFEKLGVKHIAFSGGEALMHSNLWSFCALLKSINVKISLLSTGITLKAHASEVVRYTDELIVSLDGPPNVHNQIRNLPSAFEKLKGGVRALKQIDSNFRVTGRCVLQKLNFKYLPEIISTAEALGLDQISFLSADVSTSAFNHQEPLTNDSLVQIALNSNEVQQFETIVEESFIRFRKLYKSRYIAENPARMRLLVQYYRAILNEAAFPHRKCNAPWVSAVVEADGEVRPCFFHKSYGNLLKSPLPDILNSPKAISFRKNLKIDRDPICERCVCSLYMGLRQMV